MIAPSSQSPRLTVCLSFDFDAMSAWLAGPTITNPAAISRGEFGAVAIPRILDLLRQYEAQATFFVPGHTALAYPHLVRAIRDAGHEIGHHGWVHENPQTLEPEQEAVAFIKGFEALAAVADVRPVGYRAPGAAFSAHTVGLLVEHGMQYDSTCSGNDFNCYYLRQGDVASSSEPYVFGECTEVVEIPFSWILDDFPHFEFADGWSPTQAPASAVREIWQGEFDYAYRHCYGGVFSLCMHPQVIGRGHRLTMLDAFLAYISSHDGVAFRSAAEYASTWKQDHPLTPNSEQPAAHTSPRTDRVSQGAP